MKDDVRELTLFSRVSVKTYCQRDFDCEVRGLRKGAIAEYPAQLVVFDSNTTVVPQWKRTLSKKIINYCYLGPQSRSR